LTQLRSDLDQFFHPDGVALVGAIPMPHLPPDALVQSQRERWGERVYFVNARGGSIGDVPVYTSVTEIPDRIGLAVISVGPRHVAGALDQCGRKGVPYALIFTAGFSEVGAEGAALETEIAEVGRRHRIRLFGPNTNTNAFERMPDVEGRLGGKIGLVTQSGHQGRPIVQGTLFGIGFSRWVPTGNEVDLEVADFIEYFAYDDDTAVIAGYLEGFRSGVSLRRALQAANDQRKPVVVIKVGSTAAGQRSAVSHTGHLTGSDAVVDGLFKQHGVVRVRDLDELLETAALFAKLPAGTGENVCLYSISGGSGTLMAEVAEAAGIVTPPLSERTQEQLHELLPAYLTVANPVDNGGAFMVYAPPEQRRRVLELIAADPAVDVIVIGITGALGVMTDNFGRDIRDFIAASPKPVIATWNSFKVDEAGFGELIASGVPLFRSFRNCFGALRAYFDYQRAAARFRHRAPADASLPATAADALAGTAGVVDAETTARVLQAFGIPIARQLIARTEAEAGAAAAELGPPVVMKAATTRIAHKSDAGLVRLGVDSPEQARSVHAELLAAAHRADPGAPVDAVLVQQQVQGGTEMIVGVTHDPVLGPAVMVGTGGVFAEVLQDVAVRPLPFDREDAVEMVRGLRGAALLAGARGRARADVDALIEVIMAVGRLAAACGPRMRELDLNPVIVGEHGAVAVDALLVTAPAAAEQAVGTAALESPA
jgi:acyl-CoA synthetase (NDP forming)